MNAVYRRLGFAMCLLLPGLVCLSGCETGGHFTIFGYTTRPPFDEGIRTVFVPIALNTTYLRGVEDPADGSGRQGVGEPKRRPEGDVQSSTGRHRVGSEGRAESQIDDPVNQFGEARDVELGYQIEVVWRDLRPGHEGDVLSNPTEVRSVD